jgi:hypothetical protein
MGKTGPGKRTSLERLFERHQLTPRCLMGVVAEMERLGDLVEVKTFWSSTANGVSSSMVAGTIGNAAVSVASWIWSAAKWTTQTVLSNASSPVSPSVTPVASGHWLCWPLVQDLANEIQQRCQEKFSGASWTDKIMTKQDFIDQFMLGDISQTDADILLCFLSTRKHLIPDVLDVRNCVRFKPFGYFADIF